MFLCHHLLKYMEGFRAPLSHLTLIRIQQLTDKLLKSHLTFVKKSVFQLLLNGEEELHYNKLVNSNSCTVLYH